MATKSSFESINNLTLSNTRTKRWATNLSEQEDSEDEEELKPSSKLNKRKSMSSLGTNATGDCESKDSRRLARMIRNRNAAQASRDRKKEYTSLLESRVAELESQLGNNSSSTISILPSNQKRQPKRSRANSITASSESVSTTLLLEQQNEHLTHSLRCEQAQSAVLRSTLELLESRFNQMEALLSSSTSNTNNSNNNNINLHVNPVTLPSSFAYPSATDLSFQPAFSFVELTPSTLMEEEEEVDQKPIITYESDVDEPSSPSPSACSVEQKLDQLSMSKSRQQVPVDDEKFSLIARETVSYQLPRKPSTLPLLVLQRVKNLNLIILMIIFHHLLHYLLHLPIQMILITVILIVLQLPLLIPMENQLKQSSQNGLQIWTLMRLL